MALLHRFPFFVMLPVDHHAGKLCRPRLPHPLHRQHPQRQIWLFQQQPPFRSIDPLRFVVTKIRAEFAQSLVVLNLQPPKFPLLRLCRTRDPQDCPGFSRREDFTTPPLPEYRISGMFINGAAILRDAVSLFTHTKPKE
jgi:hypothetical protein